MMLFRALLFVVFLCTGMVASAAPLVSVGLGVIYEKSSDGRTIETRTPYAIGGGYRFSELDVHVEYSMFRAGDGESLVKVDREYHEFMLWARRFFLPEWSVQPYAGAGIGLQFEKVETSFDQEVSRETGDPGAVYAAKAGMRFPLDRHFEALIEGKVAVAARYPSEPLWGLGAAAEIHF